MTILQSIFLGALQGLTELFPVSSLGHTVLIPQLFHWNIAEQSETFLIFLVTTHLATSLVLFGFYWKEWVAIISGIFRSLKIREIKSDDAYARLGWMLIIGTIPAGILGLLFEDKLKMLFASPVPVSVFLFLNGLMLLGIEYLRKRKKETMKELSFWQAIKIGCAECLALLPGFSRTGATLGGGIVSGLDHSDAAKFSFLLATPIIFAAAVLKLPELLAGYAGGATFEIVIGAIVAAIAAYGSVRYLEKYFKTKTLAPFGVYCCTIGIVCLILFIA
jgi:undecaprenyl-diphosphatase